MEDLPKAFRTFTDFREMMNESLLPALRNCDSATVAVLAVQGLYQIETVVGSEQFQLDDEIKEAVSVFLRKWRCESPLDYQDKYSRNVKLLRSLTIFKHFEVPLFIDNYGCKILMSEFDGQSLQKFDYNLKDTKIVHVTHKKEKEQILKDEQFKPSDKKNAIEGVWFSPRDYLEHQGNLRSKYGSYAFETTLEKLGISGLTQGEIVKYKNEVNFILYPSDTVQDTVWRATDDAIKLEMKNEQAYVAVSIFVPWNILSDRLKESLNMFTHDPYEVQHYPFCVRERRNPGSPVCRELRCR